MKNQKTFFLFSFFPALAYWYLEANYSLQTALIGGLILASIEMLAEWIFTKHIHTISRFNFGLILFLGALSLLAQEGVWFKLQPAFTGWVMGGYLVYKYIKNESLIFEIVTQMNKNPPPEEIIKWTERNMGIFMFCYGTLMALIAVYGTTDTWLFWKTVGFYICSGIFMVIQTFLSRIKVKRMSR